MTDDSLLYVLKKIILLLSPRRKIEICIYNEIFLLS